MMGKMLKKMMYYIVLMMVVLLSYGVFRQSLLFPNEEWSWFLVRDVLFQVRLLFLLFLPISFMY